MSKRKVGLYVKLNKAAQERYSKSSKKLGTLTLKKLQKLYDAVYKTTCESTHFIDRDGLHKINAKPRTKSRRLLDTPLDL